MKTTKIYIEVPVAERLPEKEGDTLFFVDKENIHYIGWYRDGGFYAFNGQKDVSPVYWLEAVEVPTDEEILNETSIKQDKHQTPFLRGVEWILQKLKINQK